MTARVSVVVLNEAWPPPSTATLEAHTVAPSVNVTVPAGTPPPEVTVAVKVTDCPGVDGFGDEVSAVVVGTAGGAGVPTPRSSTPPSPSALVAVTT